MSKTDKVRLKKNAKFRKSDLVLLEKIFKEYVGENLTDPDILEIKKKMYVGIDEDIKRHVHYLERRGYKVTKPK